MTKPCGDKLCPRKGEPLPLTEFYVDRRRKSGKGLYCKKCSRRHVRAYLAKKREQKAARKLSKPVERKENVLAPIERVQDAIARGKQTRDAIHKDTQLDLEQICDVIAELWDSGTVRVRRVEGEAYFLLRKVAA